MLVFLKQARMPAAPAWAQAIRDAGFPMEMETDFNPRSFTGFLPCKYKGEEAGFEFFLSNIDDYKDDIADDLPPEHWQKIGDRNTVVDFVTHSEFRDLMTSVIASGVLCSISDGVFLDTESGEITPSAAALAWSRKGESEIAKDLD